MLRSNPRRGQPISGHLTADFISQVERVVRRVLNEGDGSASQIGMRGTPAIVWGRNDESEDLERFEVVEVQDGLITDTAEFDDQFVEFHPVKIERPNESLNYQSHVTYGITQQKILSESTSPNGRPGFGEIRVKGLTIAMVKHSEGGDDGNFATIFEGELVSTRRGPFKIIAREDSKQGDVVKALIDLDPPKAQLIAIGRPMDRIEPGDKGSIRIWRRVDDAAPTGTNSYQDAWHDWLTLDLPIEANDEVVIAYFDDEDVWRIIGAPCNEEAKG